MPTPETSKTAHAAILLLAAIKDSVAEFDRGEQNAIDVVDAVIVVVEAYRAAWDWRKAA